MSPFHCYPALSREKGEITDNITILVKLDFRRLTTNKDNGIINGCSNDLATFGNVYAESYSF